MTPLQPSRCGPGVLDPPDNGVLAGLCVSGAASHRGPGWMASRLVNPRTYASFLPAQNLCAGGSHFGIRFGSWLVSCRRIPLRCGNNKHKIGRSGVVDIAKLIVDDAPWKSPAPTSSWCMATDISAGAAKVSKQVGHRSRGYPQMNNQLLVRASYDDDPLLQCAGRFTQSFIDRPGSTLIFTN